MNTAPMTSDCNQTANAVVIGFGAWLERPACDLKSLLDISGYVVDTGRA